MKTPNGFVEQFTNEKIDDIRLNNDFFESNPDLEKISENIFPVKNYPGAFLGEVKKNEFIPSIYLLEWISKRTDNKIFLNSKSEWFFLCKRDVFFENIIKNNSTKKIFLVQNEKDENLGFGKLMNHQGKRMIKNLIDRGDFLRRER